MCEIYFNNGLSGCVSKSYDKNGDLIFYQELLKKELHGFYKNGGEMIWWQKGVII